MKECFKNIDLGRFHAILKILLLRNLSAVFLPIFGLLAYILEIE